MEDLWSTIADETGIHLIFTSAQAWKHDPLVEMRLKQGIGGAHASSSQQGTTREKSNRLKKGTNRVKILPNIQRKGPNIQIEGPNGRKSR